MGHPARSPWQPGFRWIARPEADECLPMTAAWPGRSGRRCRHRLNRQRVGAVRLGGAQTDDDEEGELVKMPRRRGSARRAVGRDEPVPRRLGRAADAAVSAGHLLQDRWLGDSRRLAVEGQIRAGKLDRIPAGRVGRQVACLTSTGPAGETGVAVVPYRADPAGSDGITAALRARTCFPPITFRDAFASAWNGSGRSR